LARLQFLAAGSSFGQGVFVNTGLASSFSQYTVYGVLPTPATGAQTISLQFRGDGTNAFTIFNQPAEGGGFIRARMLFMVTN